MSGSVRLVGSYIECTTFLDGDAAGTPDRVRLHVDAKGRIADSWIDGVNTGDAATLADHVNATTLDHLEEAAIAAAERYARDAD